MRIQALCGLISVTLFGCIDPAPELATTEQEIVGGVELPIHLPFVVAIYARRPSGDSQWCGGTLVAPDWVMTSAHCATYANGDGPVEPERFFVVYGERDLGEVQPEHEIDVARIVHHPDFDLQMWSLDHDVALFQLARPVPHALTIGYDRRGIVDGPSTGFAVGWGQVVPDQFEPWPGFAADAAPTATPDEQLGSNELRGVQLHTMTNAACNQHYIDGLIANGVETAPDEQIIPTDATCTYNTLPQGPTEACIHDDGGPLLVFDPRRLRFVVAAIALPYYACADSEFPGVLTRTADNAEFIRATIGR